MPCTVVVGGFFGDEGKGKIISYLALHDKPAIVARGGAGPNAGHTIRDGSDTYKVRMLPSGFLHRQARLMVGPGVVVDPGVFLGEIKDFGAWCRSFLDSCTGIIEEDHKSADRKGSLKAKIGSTGSGTGPANAARAMRTLKLAKDVPELSEYVTDVPKAINAKLDEGGRILIEGTQGTFLSLWHGTYPFVTSKDVTASGICADVGLGPKRVDDVILVFKSYVTRVGTGPLAGQLDEDETVRRGWDEVGTVTGRPRRAAEFDFELAKRAVMLNSATSLAITKLDTRFPNCAGATSYGDLDSNAKSFLETIEAKLHVPVSLIGTGPNADQIIDRRP